MKYKTRINAIINLFIIITAVIQFSGADEINKQISFSDNLSGEYLAPNSNIKFIGNPVQANGNYGIAIHDLQEGKGSSWVSFLLLFLERGYFPQFKYWAILQIADLDFIPDGFKDKIKKNLISHLNDDSSEICLIAAYTIGALFKKNILDFEFCMDVFKITLSSDSIYFSPIKKEFLRLIYTFNKLPNEYKQNIASILEINSSDETPQVRELAFLALKKMLASKLIVNAMLSNETIKLVENLNISDKKIIDSEISVNSTNFQNNDFIELVELFNDRVLKENNYTKAIKDFESMILPGFMAMGKKIFVDNKHLINLPLKTAASMEIAQGNEEEFSNFFDLKKDKIFLLGRSIKIEKNDGPIIMLKIQLQNETDMAFNQEASIMNFDSKIKTKFNDVKLSFFNFEELTKHIGLQGIKDNLKIEDGRVLVLRYSPYEKYLNYGEEIMDRENPDENKKVIREMMDAWINDLFYLLKNYGIAYFDLLPLMHDLNTDRKFSLEYDPLGEIDSFKYACKHSNLRASGLSDFSPDHYYEFHDGIDAVSLWFISRYQLFQMILKIGNLVYKGNLASEYFSVFTKEIVQKYSGELKNLFDLETDKFIETDTIIFDEIIAELSLSLEMCYRDGVYPLEEDFERNTDQHGAYSVYHGKKWYIGELGSYNTTSFPVPSLLKLINMFSGNLINSFLASTPQITDDSQNEFQNVYEKEMESEKPGAIKNANGTLSVSA